MSEDDSTDQNQRQLVEGWLRSVKAEHEGLQARAFEEDRAFQRFERSSFILSVALTSVLFVGLIAELPAALSWLLAFVSLGVTLMSLVAGRCLGRKDALHRAALRFGDTARELDERLTQASAFSPEELRAIRSELSALVSSFRDYTVSKDLTRIKVFLGDED